MRHRVVERDPAQKGFVVLAGRWVVERSFGWLVHWGGLLRDRAGRLDVSAARVACAAILSGVEALLNPMPVQDAASQPHSNRLSARKLLSSIEKHRPRVSQKTTDLGNPGLKGANHRYQGL